MLGKRLREIIGKITKKPYIDEGDVKVMIKEIQKALIAADVDVRLVLDLSKRIEKRALGEQMRALTLKQHVFQIVYEELVKLMGEGYSPRLERHKVLLCGLYGSGKTTTAGKLAHFFKKNGLKPALVAADFDRPAAIEQLRQLATQINCAFYSAASLEEVLEKVKEAREDVVIIDSAGRNALDERLLEELRSIYSKVAPEEVFLVVSGDMGQSAGKQARAISEVVPISAVIVTKMDSSAKGGAALSAVSAANAKIAFIGMGEKIEDLRLYDPKKFVGRLLGIPDIEGLLAKAKEAGLEEVAEEELTAETLLKQLKAAKKMGPLKNILSMMGAVDLPKELVVQGEEKLKGIEAIIQSMTKEERRDVSLLKRQPSRIRRIAKGSGRSEKEVREFIAQFEKMEKLMKRFKKDRGMKRKLEEMFKRWQG